MFQELDWAVTEICNLQHATILVCKDAVKQRYDSKMNAERVGDCHLFWLLHSGEWGVEKIKYSEYVRIWNETVMT